MDFDYSSRSCNLSVLIIFWLLNSLYIKQTYYFLKFPLYKLYFYLPLVNIPILKRFMCTFSHKTWIFCSYDAVLTVKELLTRKNIGQKTNDFILDDAFWLRKNCDKLCFLFSFECRLYKSNNQVYKMYILRILKINNYQMGFSSKWETFFSNLNVRYMVNNVPININC